MATVDVFAVGSSRAAQLQHINYYNRFTIATLGVKSRKFKRVVTSEDGSECKDLLKKGRAYLQWLDTIEMTPEIKEKTTTPKMLQLIINNPDLLYPEDMKNSAGALYEKWESENWGADEVVSEDAAEEEVIPEAGEEVPIIQSQLPPPNHPIYGEHGIMHGIVVARGPKGRISYQLNPRVPKRSAKVFGHNNIPVGAWFANQLVALHRGAHGARMGGIAGSTEAGTYSIVVSNVYDDLDNDQGDILYYSGSNSHKNEDPFQSVPSSAGTKALKASLQTRHPVRVLRSGGPHSSNNNRWLPECGIRYDGLYQVVGWRERKNKKGKNIWYNEDAANFRIGGLYEQFRLCRDPGQPPLEDLRRTSPTAQQKRDLNRFQQGY
ncbi:PUA-like domain-containing protein [Daldinia loculata]|uniref:PUA-like domain-containing protein n=1 Tax=Daldinia loculata TaxID=103429 RepID=UPI0020C46942|nr:PUA-like domain-containing protein [Daldinia loculata]KAI1645784.1 PUA-like domain-containing protein [Daldinia loculata]